MSSESQYGRIFIPPFVVNPNMVDGGNPNLHNTAIINGVVFSGGIGDHGFTATVSGESPPPRPPHSENSNVMFHHKNYLIAPNTFTSADGTVISAGTTINPFSVYSEGTYTSFTEFGTGIPTKSIQGVQMLWENFYEKYYQISELEWSTERPYYHYLWSQYLAQFVMEFLPSFFSLTENKQTTIDATEIENKDSIYYYTQLIQNDSTFIGDITQAKLSYANSLESSLPNLDLVLFAESDSAIYTAVSTIYDSYNTLFDNPTASAFKTLQQWYLGYDADNYDDLVAATNIWYQADPASLEDAWDVFMAASDVVQRNKASFLWSYNEVIAMLAVLQATGEYQSDRLLVYNSAEEASVSAMDNNVHFKEPSSSSDKGTLKSNQSAQNSMQVYKSYQDINGKYLSQQNSAVSGTQSDIKSQSSIMETVMQTMDGLLQGIFNR
jgi:hypothetical protein